MCRILRWKKDDDSNKFNACDPSNNLETLFDTENSLLFEKNKKKHT